MKHLTLKCRACGWTWQAKVPHPSKCPSCQSTAWDGPETRQRAREARLAQK